MKKIVKEQKHNEQLEKDYGLKGLKPMKEADNKEVLKQMNLLIKEVEEEHNVVFERLLHNP